jgi:hypothetical protein
MFFVRKEKAMRDTNHCPLYSQYSIFDIPCSYPNKKKCGLTKVFYRGKVLKLCAWRLKELGFVSAWNEAVVIERWIKN